MTTELNTDIETQISKDEKHAYEWKNATDKLSNLTNKTVTRDLQAKVNEASNKLQAINEPRNPELAALK